MESVLQVNYYIKKGSNWIAKNGRDYLRWGWFPFIWLITAYVSETPLYIVIGNIFLPMGIYGAMQQAIPPAPGSPTEPDYAEDEE